MPFTDNTLDLLTYPFENIDSEGYASLLARCRQSLVSKGLFSLAGLLSEGSCIDCVNTLVPRIAKDAFTHRRQHNIFFSENIPQLASSHPANTKLETSNRTLCHDQLIDTVLPTIYHYQPFIDFLAACMGIDKLYPMADPLAAVNVMAYHEGEALNWHFDRSEFTTTLLLQAPQQGGCFEYRRGLKTATTDTGNAVLDYDAIGELLAGCDKGVEREILSAGSLNVFRGIDTLHRVSPVAGNIDRIIAVFSYFDRPGVEFSAEERTGFYGRAG